MPTPAHEPEDLAHARAWIAAAREPVVVDLVEGVYAECAHEIELRAPSCWASGRCCNFESTGHRLYVTGLEAACTLSRLDGPLATESLAAAHRAGGCPFQSRNLCTVHTIKPLGCRTYFCDRTATEWSHELTERGMDRLRAIHDLHAIPYRYAEWRSLLGLLLAAGA